MRILCVHENLLSEDVAIIIKLIILSPSISIAWYSLTVQASQGTILIGIVECSREFGLIVNQMQVSNTFKLAQVSILIFQNWKQVYSEYIRMILFYSRKDR